MKPTRISVLVASAVLVGVVSWLVVQQAYDSLPPLSSYGPITLGLLAIAEFGFALSIRRRLRNPAPGHRLEPLFVLRLAVLAKASSHAAAVVAGVYAGFLGYTLPNSGKGRITTDTRASAISLGVSLALVAAALFLEYSCRVPRPPEDRDADHAGSGTRFS